MSAEPQSLPVCVNVKLAAEKGNFPWHKLQRARIPLHEITRLSRDLRGCTQMALMAQVLGDSSLSCSNLAVFHPPEIEGALESRGFPMHMQVTMYKTLFGLAGL